MAQAAPSPTVSSVNSRETLKAYLGAKLKSLDPQLLQYDASCPLDSGSFGTVFEGRYGQDDVAVKVFSLDWSALEKGDALSFRYETIAREIDALAALRESSYVVRFYGFVWDDGADELRMVTKLLKRQTKQYRRLDAVWGDLRESKPGVTNDERLRIGVMILGRLCKALADVHGRGFAHLDLTLNNVMVRFSLTEPKVLTKLKLIDFGMTLPTKSPDTSLLPGQALVGGTMYFTAPEQERRRQYRQLEGSTSNDLSTRCDMYSFGVIGICLLSGMHPSAVRAYVQDVDFLKHVPDVLRDMLRKCLADDWKQRPTVKDMKLALRADSRLSTFLTPLKPLQGLKRPTVPPPPPPPPPARPAPLVQDEIVLTDALGAARLPAHMQPDRRTDAGRSAPSAGPQTSDPQGFTARAALPSDASTAPAPASVAAAQRGDGGPVAAVPVPMPPTGNRVAALRRVFEAGTSAPAPAAVRPSAQPPVDRAAWAAAAALRERAASAQPLLVAAVSASAPPVRAGPVRAHSTAALSPLAPTDRPDRHGPHEPELPPAPPSSSSSSSASSLAQQLSTWPSHQPSPTASAEDSESRQTRSASAGATAIRHSLAHRLRAEKRQSMGELLADMELEAVAALPRSSWPLSDALPLLASQSFADILVTPLRGAYLAGMWLPLLQHISDQRAPITVLQFSVDSTASGHDMYDVHVAVAPQSSEQPICEVVLGGWKNTESVVRKRAQSYVVARAFGPVSPGPYWVYFDWVRKLLCVGSGLFGPAATRLLRVSFWDELLDERVTKPLEFAFSSWKLPLLYHRIRCFAMDNADCVPWLSGLVN